MALEVFLMSAVNYIWGLFKLWIHTIFVVPFETTDMLWLLVPVWVAWFFSEFFQEKTGTSLGNAISNAVIILWGSIDCTRQTVKLMSTNAIRGFWEIFPRFAIILAVFIYGFIIVFLGWKGDKLIKKIGRIREVTYVFVIFVPVFYNAAILSWDHVIAAVLFFPLFYFAIELIDRYTPNPKAVVEDMNEIESSKSTEKYSRASEGSRPPQQQYRRYPPRRESPPGATYYPYRTPYNRYR